MEILSSRRLREADARVPVVEHRVVRPDEDIAQDPEWSHRRRDVQTHKPADALLGGWSVGGGVSRRDAQDVLLGSQRKTFPAEHEGDIRQTPRAFRVHRRAIDRALAALARDKIAQALDLLEDRGARRVGRQKALRVGNAELARRARDAAHFFLRRSVRRETLVDELMALHEQTPGGLRGLRAVRDAPQRKQRLTRRFFRLGRRGTVVAEPDAGAHLLGGEVLEVVEELVAVRVDGRAALLAQHRARADLRVDRLDHLGGAREQRRPGVHDGGAPLGAATPGGSAADQHVVHRDLPVPLARDVEPRVRADVVRRVDAAEHELAARSAFAALVAVEPERKHVLTHRALLEGVVEWRRDAVDGDLRPAHA
mmetsp:Transcript_9168/g.38831  ORF Transcript_9168/g.38831 Transcript_9168/m.38831 type:complete len:368 (-) Transcript_9168:663-1766(-)